ncbi:3-hydroxyacyl-CoA dehydrogenase family protein [Cyclobacterium plantarum]|uniref:3-hydroxyacyl-CoA dehydrogenase family protein n=1 Tax=Cyclobacterium plantarum TaxID=2716263 RepID=UPI003F70A66E
MKKVSVIGAGTMGSGIAHTFAQQGFEVQLIDKDKEPLKNAMESIEMNLKRQQVKGLIDYQKVKETVRNIQPERDLKKGVESADLVVEAVIEEFDAKAKIFQQLDKFCPKTCILSSNTSSISIGKLAAFTKRPDKVIGMHFMNPVPVMKLVEVISGINTSRETVNAILKVTASLGKSPVMVKDYPGFIANRILMPMINEAIFSLHEGVAGVEEIDQVMHLGMAHPMGPLELADLIGLDVCLAILKVLQEGMGSNKYAPCPLLVNLVNAGYRGKKSGAGFYEYQSGTKQKQVAYYFNNH